MSYDPMPPPPPPGYSNYPGQAMQKGEPPRPVALAVRLMLINAVIGVLAVIFVLTLRGQIRDSLRDKYPSYTSSHIDSLVTTAVTIAAVVGLVFLLLYVLLALQVRKGRNWARIVTWVLAGLGVASALSTLAQNEPTLNKVLALVQGALDVAIIVLLARRESQPYFRPAVDAPPGYPPPGY
jgi:hypothetical protein